ncbi:uncharacterized protein LOC131858498 [Cryptomeria japonica]|uniref:uncharacterized protein LOC131858498 n=1 Tax=Cryptomeria japonica TaxID=3369 RepID=UPI0027DA10A6|nr:uncharacterized protein LOC131858498 [Cryptomeria japonica]
MSYREIARELVETRDELEILRHKFKASQARRKELIDQLLEISDNSSSDELKNYHNKPNQTETGAPPELDTEEIVVLDEVYTAKDKDDTISPPIIFFVDETKDVQDTINIIGTNNELVKEKEQEPDMVKEQKEEEALTAEQSMDMQPPPVKKHNVESQLPPVITPTQEEQIETEKKLGQLVVDASEQLKSFEESVHALAKKDYRKKREEKLISEIDKGKVALIVNKDLLKTGIETGAMIEQPSQEAQPSSASTPPTTTTTPTITATTTTTTTPATTSTMSIVAVVSTPPPPLAIIIVTPCYIASRMPAPTMIPKNETITSHNMESDSDQEEAEPTPKKVEPKNRKRMTPSSTEKRRELVMQKVTELP